MNIRPVLLAISLALAAPAFASDCPNLMAEVDAVLAESKDLEQAVRDQVVALRAEGEALHVAGDHEGSMDKLKEAFALLGIE